MQPNEDKRGAVAGEPILGNLAQRLLIATLQEPASRERTPISLSLDASLFESKPGPRPRESVDLESGRSPTLSELIESANQQLELRSVFLSAPWVRSAEVGADGPATVGLDRPVLENVLVELRAPRRDSTLVAMLPSSSLVSQSGRIFREKMQTSWREELVIAGSGLVERLYEGIQVSMVLYRGRHHEGNRQKFFAVSRQAAADELLSDFAELLQRRGGKTRYGYVLQEDVAHGDSLDFERNDPSVQSRRRELSDFGTAKALFEVFDPVPTGVHLVADRAKLSREPRDGQVRVLSGRDIDAAGYLKPPSEGTFWARVDRPSTLDAGDLVMQGLVHPQQQRLVLAEIVESDLPACIEHTVIALRPRKEVGQESIRLAVLFLRSKFARILARTETGQSVRLSQSSLREYPIPQPDAALVSAMREMEDAKRFFLDSGRQAEVLLASVFEETTARVAHRKILESGRTLRMRADAARRSDDLVTSIRTTYPYPLAYRWRSLEASRTYGSEGDAYRLALEAGEVFLAFISIVALAAARELSVEIKSKVHLAEKFSSGRTGPTFGDWLRVFQEIGGSRALRREVAQHEFLRLLMDAAADPELGQAVSSLKKKRDDASHLRQPSGSELTNQLNQAFAEVETCYRSVRFLSEVSLFAVDSLRWDSLTNRGVARGREMVGDHPVVPAHDFTAKIPMESGSLYLLIGERPILLRPFLLGRTCPECGQWSSFHPDKVTGDKVLVESLEHSHQVLENGMMDGLRASGLLRNRPCSASDEEQF